MPRFPSYNAYAPKGPQLWSRLLEIMPESERKDC